MVKQKFLWFFAGLSLFLITAINAYFPLEDKLTAKFHNELILGDKADLDRLEFLIEQGVNVDSAYRSGDKVYSPLSLAALSDNFKAAYLLISNGADVNQVVEGKTVLDIACENSSDEFIGMLVRHNAVINQYISDDSEKDVSPYCN